MNPKNLILTLGAAAGLAQLGVSTTAVMAMLFLVLGVNLIAKGIPA